MQEYRVITIEAFLRGMAELPPGSAIIYYKGHLPYDTAYKKDLVNAKVLSNMAWDAMLAGKVHLVQRRSGNEFEYLAVLRPKPHKTVVWKKCYAPGWWKALPSTKPPRPILYRIHHNLERRTA